MFGAALTPVAISLFSATVGVLVLGALILRRSEDAP